MFSPLKFICSKPTTHFSKIPVQPTSDVASASPSHLNIRCSTPSAPAKRRALPTFPSLFPFSSFHYDFRASLQRFSPSLKLPTSKRRGVFPKLNPPPFLGFILQKTEFTNGLELLLPLSQLHFMGQNPVYHSQSDSVRKKLFLR